MMPDLDLAPAHRLLDEAAELRGRLQAELWRMFPDEEARARALISELDGTILVYKYVLATAAMLPDKSPAGQ